MNAFNSNIINSGLINPILDKIPLLFRNFPPDSYREFLECGTLKKFDQGNIILSAQASQLNSGCLIVKGEVSVHLHDVPVQNLKSGDFLGETFIFKKNRNPVRVQAESDGYLISFEREPVLEFFRGKGEKLFKIFVMNMLLHQNQQLIWVH